jgi:hypothetical protein
LVKIKLKKVCELDIIFNFEKAHFVWNELVVSGEFMESSRRDVLEAVLDQDDIQAVINNKPILCQSCVLLKINKLFKGRI